jgi:outer membrane protein assembly factor BamC
MKIKFSSLIIAAALVNVSACTYIKNLFPDKEKDYQFTTEIPPLILPASLSADSLSKAPLAPISEAGAAAPVVRHSETVAAPVAAAADQGSAAAAAVETPVVAETAEIDEVAPYTPAPATEADTAIERKAIQLELIDVGTESGRLRIGAAPKMAWRLVGKALSRKSIEVTTRNQDDRLFHVQYDADKQVVEDDSIFDEMTFFFSGLAITERQYIIKLIDINPQQTDVIVVDAEQKPVADAGSLSLLKLLHDTIKADLAK